MAQRRRHFILGARFRFRSLASLLYFVWEKMRKVRTVTLPMNLKEISYGAINPVLRYDVLRRDGKQVISISFVTYKELSVPYLFVCRCFGCEASWRESRVFCINLSVSFVFFKAIFVNGCKRICAITNSVNGNTKYIRRRDLYKLLPLVAHLVGVNSV